ncbi:transient receptor potential cation channel subfamily V member 6-like [Ambystoma mexicanum]|uniref:transient receptor potential cation channel subfamily V member 6-like n=1 Tax=Ambystoma mexicanum TaxID=8296 RepID=UPI0037E79CB8
MDKLRDTHLFKAARTNDIITMETLLHSGTVDPFVRGNLGETILHVALLNGNPEVAFAILKIVPSLIDEPMECDIYKGETALHIAILKQDVETVTKLLALGADVHAQASGTCFMPGKECLCYYGEFPLSFAACIGNEEITRLLIDHKARLDAQDSLGNTVFHVLTLQPDKKITCRMYDMIIGLVPQKTCQVVERLKNHKGLTPLKIAAFEGDITMFKYFVQRQKKVYWKMGTISYCIYDLTHIDSSADPNSVLDIITSSRNTKVRKLLSVTPVKELLNEKWRSFGYKNFIMWMCCYIVYIVVFTIASVYRPLKPLPPGEGDNFTIMRQMTMAESYVTKLDYLRLVGELITLLGAIVILFCEIPHLVKIGPKHYIGHISVGGPFSLLMVVYSLLIFCVLIARILGSEGAAIPLSLALIIGWCNCIYFARGFRMLGQFSIMIQKIIFADLMQWCTLVLICVIGFTSAFFVVFQTMDLNRYLFFENYAITMYTMVELMMGLINLPVPNDTPSPVIVYIIYALYMVFVYLLMLNILIAMMDDTYWRVAEEREELWKTQIAATILLLERRLPRFLKKQSGISGHSLGFDDQKRYFGVEEISSEPVVMETSRSAVCWNIIRKNIIRIIHLDDSDESTHF